MRHSVRPLVAAAFTVALVVGTAVLPTSAVCTGDVCTSLFTVLRVDIVTGVESNLQTSLLVKTFASERLIPTDPCRALLPLQALQHQVDSLVGTHIAQHIADTLTVDISALAEVIAPTDPC